MSELLWALCAGFVASVFGYAIGVRATLLRYQGRLDRVEWQLVNLGGRGVAQRQQKPRPKDVLDEPRAIREGQ